MKFLENLLKLIAIFLDLFKSFEIFDNTIILVICCQFFFFDKLHSRMCESEIYRTDTNQIQKTSILDQCSQIVDENYPLHIDYFMRKKAIYQI